MSVGGGTPIDTSILQAAQAQVTAGKARDKERAERERARRLADQVELRVDNVESAEAIRRLPRNDSEQAEAEHEARGEDEAGGRVDVKA